MIFVNFFLWLLPVIIWYIYIYIFESVHVVLTTNSSYTLYIYLWLFEQAWRDSYNKGIKLNNPVLCIYLLLNESVVVYLTPLIFHNGTTGWKLVYKYLYPPQSMSIGGTHTSLHLFVFYAGFQSLLQYHSSMSSVRYNEAVLYKDLVRAWSPIFMYKDHWQVSIVYLNFLVTMWIHLKSRSPK